MRIYLRRLMITVLLLFAVTVVVLILESNYLGGEARPSVKREGWRRFIDAPFDNVWRRAVVTLPPRPAPSDGDGGDCSELKGPPRRFATQSWQDVTDAKTAYVFSAFLDDTGGGGAAAPSIRVIAVRTQQSPQRLYCQLWFDDDGSSSHQQLAVVEALTQNIPEDHGKMYMAAYVKCFLPGKTPPYAVSVVPSRCQPPLNALAVSPGHRATNSTVKQFTVCLTPLNFRFGRAYELVEWMEINQLFGAEYFTFYNYSTSPNVDAVLGQYVSRGLAEVVQWHLPIKVDTWPPTQPVNIHYFGQLAALNDCLYRNLHRSKYIVFIDLDEFVVPKIHSNWKSLLSSVPQADRYAAFIFQCTFFRKDWPDTEEPFDERAAAEKYHAVSLLKVNREPKIHPPYLRSKHIVNPLYVETVGIHNVWTFRAGLSAYEISPSVGLLHHYRNWENPGDQNRLLDRSMHRFAKEIAERLEKRWSSLKGIPLEIKGV